MRTNDAYLNRTLQDLAKVQSALKDAHEARLRAEEDLAKMRGLMQDDHWAWMGDEHDDLNTMSEDMVVRITAGDLRRMRHAGMQIERRKIAEQIGMEIPEGTLQRWHVTQYVHQLGKLSGIARVLEDKSYHEPTKDPCLKLLGGRPASTANDCQIEHAMHVIAHIDGGGATGCTEEEIAEYRAICAIGTKRTCKECLTELPPDLPVAERAQRYKDKWEQVLSEAEAKHNG